MNKLIFFFILSMALAQEETVPNPTRGDLEYPGGNTLRVGTWSLGGITYKKLKSRQPIPYIFPNKKIAEVPLELMNKYNIDVLCLNHIYQRKRLWGVESAKGTIFGEYVQHSYGGEDFSIETTKLKNEFFPIVWRTNIGTIIAKKSSVSCQPPVPNILSFGNSSRSQIHWVSCFHKKSKRRFFMGCAHINETKKQLKKSIAGLDKMTTKTPLSFNGRGNSFIIGGDFNSFPGKKSTTTNPFSKKTLGWNELGIPLPKKISITPFNDEDITFTKVFRKRGNKFFGKRLFQRNVDDLIHSLDLNKHWVQKSVLPVQIFLLDPQNNANQELDKQRWVDFGNITDHLPVTSDFSFP